MISRLDPRRSLAAAIGWAVFAVVVLASLLAAELAAGEAERAARDDAQRLLGQYAEQIAHTLDADLRTRLSIVQATAAQIAASRDRGADALRAHLDALRAHFPEFVWLGVADERGRLLASTGSASAGDSAAGLRWFVRAQSGPYVGGVRVATDSTGQEPLARADAARWVVDVAAPVEDAAGRRQGAIGAALAWAWIEALRSDLLASLEAGRGLQVLLVDGGGRVLSGPSSWTGRVLHGSDDAQERGAFVVGRHALVPRAGSDLDLVVLVRQSSATALAPVRRVRGTVFVTVLLVGLLSAGIAVAAARALTRRLRALAVDAQAVRHGGKQEIAVPRGRDEVSRIGATISELVHHLQREKAALAALNAALDARVAERTARIERMADEARHAAVIRERLRLARALHDTLAHSLMALLTQIRMVRKVRGRLSSDELDRELGSAEDVAASGLADARAAIAQMRHGGASETGLSAALADLIERFGESTGIAATLQSEGGAADLTGERAEAVFRIVEEALRNVERHARARSVLVSLTTAAPPAGSDVTEPRVCVTVTDDGVGFDSEAAHPGHYGLLGMREQAQMIGAELQVRSAPGEGTRLRLEFPA